MFNFTGLLIGLTHIFLPFMVLMLIGVDPEHRRATSRRRRATLGANWGPTFVQVTLPLSVPGILSGSILVFVLTISALVTPRLLGGPTYKVDVDADLRRSSCAARLAGGLGDRSFV